MLDDFANLNIENIDNILSIVRSREIWCTLFVQSINQLDAIYGHARAQSIISNCDTQLVLAFQDAETARCFNDRADKLPTSLLQMSRKHAMLFIAGARGEEVEKYRLEEHPLYRECMKRAEQGARSAKLKGRVINGVRGVEGLNAPIDPDLLELDMRDLRSERELPL